jgi:iron complex transport system substrate-binding protein
LIRLPLLAAALTLGTSAVSPPGEAVPVAPPQRIVSLNLCADQLLVPLADRAQIAALNMNARDPWMSAVAAQAKGYRLIRGSAEEVLALDPGLILGAPAFRTDFLRSLSGRNYRAIELPPANSYAEIKAQVASVAAATGHTPRGERLVRRMDLALARIPRNGGRRVAAYYQRRGYLTGAGTLVDELMTRAGLVNLATKLRKPPLSRLSLEEMVAAQPDVLIVETDSDAVTDQGAEMLQHPSLRHIPRVTLAQAWTVCGGPAYVQAAQSLAMQLAVLPPGRT